MRAAFLLLALLLLPAAEASTGTFTSSPTSHGTYDAAPPDVRGFLLLAVGTTNATFGWEVHGCAASTWVAYRDTAAPSNGWLLTRAQNGSGAFQATLTGLAPSHRYVAFVDGEGNCGGPWSLQPTDEACFETRPAGGPRCSGYSSSSSSPTPNPTTGGFLTRPVGYDARVLDITATSANITWRGATCEWSNLRIVVYGPDDPHEFRTPPVEGPGPHAYLLEDIPPGSNVQFEVGGCTGSYVAFCFRADPVRKECEYSGHTIAPLFGDARADPISRARPALAIGAGFACLALLGLGRLRARLA